MKKILIIFCCILAMYAILFPFTYFNSNMDKKDVRISHILLNTKDEAAKVKQEIINGQTFESMVQKYSLDDTSGINGEIGNAIKGKFDVNIINTVYKMNKNDISDPIESEYGWHVIKVTDVNYFSNPDNFKYNKYKYLENIEM